MGNTSSRSVTATETYGLSAQIAEAFADVVSQLRAIASTGLRTRIKEISSCSDIPGRARSLLQTFGWKRAAATPRLQFNVAAPALPAIVDDEVTAPEADPWAEFDNVSTIATRQALHLAELHISATNCLDAADYALQRLKLELSAVAPDLVASLSIPSLPAESAPAALADPAMFQGPGSVHGIAA